MINRKVSMLNAQQGPRLKDDVPATVATNRCVGYEIAMMDERRIFIENKAATMDLQELAPIKSGIRSNPASTKSGIERQAEELKGKRQQFVKDTAKRWPRAVEQLRRIAWFHIVHSFAKSISTSTEEIHDKSSSAPTHPPGRNRQPGRCADGGAAPRTRRVHGQVPGTRRPGPRHNRPHPHRE